MLFSDILLDIFMGGRQFHPQSGTFLLPLSLCSPKYLTHLKSAVSGGKATVFLATEKGRDKE